LVADVSHLRDVGAIGGEPPNLFAHRCASATPLRGLLQRGPNGLRVVQPLGAHDVKRSRTCIVKPYMQGATHRTSVARFVLRQVRGSEVAATSNGDREPWRWRSVRLRDQARIARPAAVAILDLDSCSTRLVDSSLIEAIALAAGAATTSGGLQRPHELRHAFLLFRVRPAMGSGWRVGTRPRDSRWRSPYATIWELK
jgi:hypothetical protein